MYSTFSIYIYNRECIRERKRDRGHRIRSVAWQTSITVECFQGFVIRGSKGFQNVSVRKVSTGLALGVYDGSTRFLQKFLIQGL